MMECKVFLGGPITNLIEKGRFDKEKKNLIQDMITQLQDQHHEVLSAHVVEQFGRVEKKADDVIVTRDLAWIDQADQCLFIFPVDHKNIPVRTDGTYIELGYAIAKQKNIMIFWEDEFREAYSPMFKGTTVKGIKFYPLSTVKEVLKTLA